MDERAEHDGSPDPPDAPAATQNVETESDAIAGEDGDTEGNGDGDAEESSGPLSRVRTVGTEAAGAVVDAVLDAL